MTTTAPTPTPAASTPTADGRMDTVHQSEGSRPSSTQGPRKNYHVREPVALWAKACEKANGEGRGIAEVIEALLTDYVTGGQDNQGA